MFTNADCTIFNRVSDTSIQKTIIRGVYWEQTNGETPSSRGLSKDCEVLIIIPKNADFDSKTYLKPKAFKGNPQNNFTFSPEDIIVKGIIDDDFSRFSQVNALEDSYTILKVVDFLYGSENVQHWEVQAK